MDSATLATLVELGHAQQHVSVRIRRLPDESVLTLPAFVRSPQYVEGTPHRSLCPNRRVLNPVSWLHHGHGKHLSLTSKRS